MKVKQTYIAADGKSFSTEKECIAYEKNKETIKLKCENLLKKIEMVDLKKEDNEDLIHYLISDSDNEKYTPIFYKFKVKDFVPISDILDLLVREHRFGSEYNKDFYKSVDIYDLSNGQSLGISNTIEPNEWYYFILYEVTYFHSYYDREETDFSYYIGNVDDSINRLLEELGSEKLSIEEKIAHYSK